MKKRKSYKVLRRAMEKDSKKYRKINIPK